MAKTRDTRGRYYTDEQSKIIRDFQTDHKLTIEHMDDFLLAALRDAIGDTSSIGDFRTMLTNERKKSKSVIGHEPYISPGYSRGPKKQCVESQPQDSLFGDDMMFANDQEKVDYITVDVERLRVDPSYQRCDFVRETRVNQMALRWSWIQCSPLLVGERSDGTMWIVDGQHRFLAAKKAGYAELPCQVFKSSGPQHEAEQFYLVNKQRVGINAITVFRACLMQKEPKAVAIQAMLDENNMRIASGGGIRCFKAAEAIRDIYDRGVLGDVLSVINDAFGDGSAQRWRLMFSQAHFIQMLGFIYANKDWKISGRRMRLVLARLNEVHYQRLAAQFAGTTGNRAKKIMPEFIEQVYNHGIRYGRITT